MYANSRKRDRQKNKCKSSLKILNIFWRFEPILNTLTIGFHFIHAVNRIQRRSDTQKINRTSLKRNTFSSLLWIFKWKNRISRFEYIFRLNIYNLRILRFYNILLWTSKFWIFELFAQKLKTPPKSVKPTINLLSISYSSILSC